MAFQQANHGAYSNPGTQVGGLEQGFQCFFTGGLDQSLQKTTAVVLSVVQAMYTTAL